MKDIFAGFTYACEKISENGFMKSAGYSSLKRMVTECKVAFENKYGSIDGLDGVKYIEEGQFPAGSMLPKVEAAMKFVRQFPSKKAIITSLDKAVEALNGETGTVITFN